MQLRRQELNKKVTTSTQVPWSEEDLWIILAAEKKLTVFNERFVMQSDRRVEIIEIQTTGKIQIVLKNRFLLTIYKNLIFFNFYKINNLLSFVSTVLSLFKIVKTPKFSNLILKFTVNLSKIFSK